MADPDDLVARCEACLGQVLNGKWKLDALLGVGGMAAVYSATHRNGARSAIKILHGSLAGDSESKARFLREAYIANKVDHPGAVSALDDDVDEQGRAYIVMELLEGESLDEKAERAGGMLPLEDVLVVADSVLEILQAAHDHDIVHRDVKPENIFLTKSGQTKLLDFGIAHIKEKGGPSLTISGSVFGTPEFMTPEQALGRHDQVDRRTDLWAVGAIVYTLVSGARVHAGETAAEVVVSAATRPPPSLAEVAPDAPASLVRLVDRALQYDPANRFDNAREMRAEIAGLFRPGLEEEELEGEEAPSRERPSSMPADTRYHHSKTPEERPTRPVETSYRHRSPPPKRPSKPIETSYRHSSPPPKRSSKPIETSYRHSSPPPKRTPRPEALDRGSEPAPKRPRKRVESSARHREPPAERRGRPSNQVPSSRGDDDAARRRPSPPAEPPRTGDTPPLAGLGARPTPSAPEPTREVDSTVVARVQAIFKHVDQLLACELEHDPDHPEALHQRERLEVATREALAKTPDGLSFQVLPFAFAAGRQIVWEPGPPFDRIPHQLFADGVRTLGLQRGLQPQELRRFLEILTMDRADDLSPEDDFVTLLWEANLEHVAVEAIDFFADGGQDQRVAYETARLRTIAAADESTRAELEACWKRSRGPAEEHRAALARSGAQLLAKLADGQPVDVDSAVRALAFGGGAESGVDAASLGRLTLLDDATLTLLGHRLDVSPGELADRFSTVAAHSFVVHFDHGSASPVTEALRRGVDSFAESEPIVAVEMVRSLSDSVRGPYSEEEREKRRTALAGAVVSERLFRALWERVKASEAELSLRGAYLDGLELILGSIDGTHVATALEAFAEVDRGTVFDMLLRYLTRVAPGNELVLGSSLSTLDLPQALSLIDVLGNLSTREGRAQIAKAARNPHPLVRIQATGLLEGASSDRLRAELTGLLQHKASSARLTALQLMEQNNVLVAGPYLALRVKSPDFARLPTGEKRQSFSTLAALAPQRAEEICVEILEDSRLVTNAAHEETREIAAETLGHIGSSTQAADVLERVAKQRWKNSERVRSAASLAFDQISRRRGSSGFVGGGGP